MAPATADRVLRWLLRCIGVTLVLALPAVVMPFVWMDRIHADGLKLGPLPDTPIVSYLARTVSLMYAVHGSILIFVSLDVARYRPLIRFIAILNGCFALSALGVDLHCGMPLWWTAWEGPLILAAAVTIWSLAGYGERAQVAGNGASNE